MTAGHTSCPHCGRGLTVLALARVIPAPETRDDLIRGLVLDVVTEHQPVSERRVVALVGRRRADVHRALLEAEAAGEIGRDERGRWIA